MGVSRVKVSEESPFFVIEDSFLVSRDGTLLIAYLGTESKVVIKKEVEKIQEFCFYDYDCEVEVAFDPDSRVQTFAKMAFHKCCLKAIVIPQSVEVIGNSCFESSGSLCEVTFEPESKLRQINRLAFFGTNLKKINIPASVKVIRTSSFQCKSLRDVTFEPESQLQKIGPKAFQGTAVKEIEIPASVEEIGDGCFRRCVRLSTVDFEAGSDLRRVGVQAFAVTALVRIVFPETVENIGENCFLACKFLREVTFEGKCELPWILFFDCAAKLIRVPPDMELNTNLPKGCQIEYFELNNPPIPSPDRLQEISSLFFDLNDKYEEITSTDRLDVNWSQITFIRHSETGESYAVKTLILPPRFNLSLIQEQFMIEVLAWNQLKHPCIVSLQGCLLEEAPKIVMEYIGGGNLKNLLRNDIPRPKWWTETRKAITVVGIVLGMQFMHSKNLNHRNLKPTNILLDNDHNVKISDFGLSRVYECDEKTMNFGNALYMAPEVMERRYDSRVDVYSFGLILYEIVSGSGFLSSCDERDKAKMLCDLMEGERPEIGEEVFGFTKDLIEKCWSGCVSERPSFGDIWEILKANEFKIVPEVDSALVEGFVMSVERRLVSVN
jgi:hypothetical protein